MAPNSSKSGHASAPIRVLCVDDQPDNRAVMRMLIDADHASAGQREMECVGELGSADRLVDEAQHLRADVVLLDATMPGRDPFEAMEQLGKESPEIRTIIYSAHDDRQFLHSAMEAGAWGCASKNDSPERLIEAVREVATGHTAFGRDH